MSKNRAYSLVVATLLLVGIGVASSVGQSKPNEPAGPCCHLVAVIDLVRVFNECAQIEDLNEVFRQQTEDARAEAKQRATVIENKQLALSAFQVGTPDHEARRRELVQMNIEANVWLKTTEQQIEQQKFDWTRILYERTLKACEAIAQERGYDLVIQRSEFKPLEGEQSVQNLRRMIQDRAVVYNVPSIDITELVIRRLDADYKSAGGKKQLNYLESTSRPADQP